MAYAKADSLLRPPKVLPRVPFGALVDDRLGRFFPMLLALTVVFTIVDGAAAVVLREAAMAGAALTTAVFGVGVLFTRHQIQMGHPARARAMLAVFLIVSGAFGAFLIPGIGAATAMLPVVSVVLVLPYVPRNRLVALIAVAIVSVLALLALDDRGHQLPAIPGVAGVLFQNAILVGVLILVLAGLTEFALDARDSLRELQETTERQIQVTTARLSIVAALRMMHALRTPEATAAGIAEALSELPNVDVAVVLEAGSTGLSVLAAAGEASHPITLASTMPPERSAYVLERSRHGAWAELWTDRPGPGLEDEGLTRLGIQGQAFAPILSGDEITGIVGIATSDATQAAHLISDRPFVGEAAAVAGAILAPALVARRELGSAKVHVAHVIATSGFHPVFQPIVELASGVTVGFEALTRFASGESPSTVFANAVKADLGEELEAATLTAAVRDAVRLPSEMWLSLNISPTMLASRTRLTEILADRTRLIMLEITEHQAIDDYAPLHAAVRELGPDVRLAVDDAGAGVANFQHLVELRPDLVKIDAGLIRGANADVSRQALIVGLVHFAAVTGAMVLAEGIETEAEKQTVLRLGVTLGQGYLLGRPVPIEQLVRIA